MCLRIVFYKVSGGDGVCETREGWHQCCQHFIYSFPGFVLKSPFHSEDKVFWWGVVRRPGAGKPVAQPFPAGSDYPG